MKWKATAIAALVLWVFTVAVLVLWNKKSDDTREKITLPEMGWAKVLSEMRGMLESLRDIEQAAKTNDYAAIAAAAHKSGTTFMVDDGPLMKIVPEGMLRMGLSVHQGFDQIEQAALAKKPMAEVHKQVADILSTCTACHAQFRLH